MSVTSIAAVANGTYEPFHTEVRAGPNSEDPVGTVAVDSGVTGDASGGTVTIGVSMRPQEFGFRLLWIPLSIVLRDNLAGQDLVNLNYLSVVNDRLDAVVEEFITMEDAAQSLNMGLSKMYALPIEVSYGTSGGNVLTAVWATNTDTKIYHLHVFGPVFDLEVMAREGKVHPLMAGIR